jgi:hypothetical protein
LAWTAQGLGAGSQFESRFKPEIVSNAKTFNYYWSPDDYTALFINDSDPLTSDCSISLPLLYFKVECHQNTITELLWEAKSIEDNEEYIVFGSENGYEFYELGKVIPSNTFMPNKAYAFIVDDPKLLYFKIGQEIKNNKIVYISTILTHCKRLEEQSFRIVYDYKEKNIILSNDGEELTMDFYNSMGVFENEAFLQHNQNLSIPMNKFAPGLNTIVITQGVKIVMQKFMIVE